MDCYNYQLCSISQYKTEIKIPIDVVSTVECFVTGYKFQENLLKTMLQIENTFFELGESCSRDCLIICDRGAMDASACE